VTIPTHCRTKHVFKTIVKNTYSGSEKGRDFFSKVLKQIFRALCSRYFGGTSGILQRILKCKNFGTQMDFCSCVWDFILSCGCFGNNFYDGISGETAL